MNHRDDTTGSSRFSRRGFLGKVGVGAVALGAPGALAAPGKAAPQRAGAAHHQLGVTQHFGRMFEQHAAVRGPGTKGLEAALVDIGSPGGILDARDALERGPADLITDLSLSAHNQNNPTHTAGTTFFGQFMDHDMTFDTASPLGKPTDPPGVAERPHAVVRPRLGVRGRPRRLAPAVRPGRPGKAEGRVGRAVRGRTPRWPTGRRSSATRATTSTS